MGSRVLRNVLQKGKALGGVVVGSQSHGGISPPVMARMINWQPRSTTPQGSFVTGQGQVRWMASEATSTNPQVHSSSSRMEKTVNNVTLMGRVGGDPQKRGTQEHPVVVFSLATHANYNQQSGGILQKTDWHRICVFKPYLRDSVYKYMSKGQRVYVTGRISYGEVKDENGVPHTTTSVIADDVIFVSNTPGGKPVVEEEVD